MVTVSVILPTYNRAHVVSRAIRSVLEQTYEDFELIVVDDGSTDSTEEVVRSFDDPRIRYIRHEQNRGGAAARNTGIRAARGEYIAFQDSDDEWLPEKLEKQMHAFLNTSDNVGVVYTDMWRVEKGRKIYWSAPSIMPEDGIIYEKAIERVLGIGLSSAVIKKICFDRMGYFNEQLYRFIDFELFIRLSKNYYFLHIKEPLVYYNYSEKSISTNNEVLIPAFELILKTYQNDMDKKSLAYIKYCIGNLLCQKNKFDKGKIYLYGAMILYPLNLKYMVAAISSLFGESAYTTVVRLKRRIIPVHTGLEG